MGIKPRTSGQKDKLSSLALNTLKLEWEHLLTPAA